MAYPPRRAGQLELRVQALLEDPERIAKLRGRLGDLSWYMKCLNEAIARRSNREDDCTGRFWEGRFNSSRPMESLAALYACMTYVDLNPLRAGATGRVAEEGEHTALRRRIEEARREERKLGEAMAPMGIRADSRRIFTGGDTRLSQLELRVQALLEDPERIAKLRGRLGDLSWYMKCLNEAIARRSNREDDCTGRFWEGRFNSSRPMESLAALYPCMTYVDLNPLRAGATGRVAEAGEHTSLRRRIEEARREERKFGEAMAPMGINGESRRIFTGGDTRLSLTLRDYLAHVEWTAGRGARPTGECAEPRLGAPPSLADPEAFLARLRSFHRRWSRKLGRGDTPLPGYKRPESGALAATA